MCRLITEHTSKKLHITIFILFFYGMLQMPRAKAIQVSNRQLDAHHLQHVILDTNLKQKVISNANIQVDVTPMSEIAFEPLVISSHCGFDHFEPNNQRRKARDISSFLTLGREVNGRICQQDEDWYSVQLTRGDLLEIKLEVHGPVSLPAMRMFAPRKRRPSGIFRRQRKTRSQHLRIYVKQSGRYRIVVKGNRQSQETYTLTMRHVSI